MRFKSALILPVLVLLIFTELLPLAVPGSAQSWSQMAAFCTSYGGSPQGGRCYFPDGYWCSLEGLYNGTCPYRADIEQRIWEAEVYRFLYSDYYPIYYPPYSYTYSSPYYSNYPYYQQGTASYWLGAGNEHYTWRRYDDALDSYDRALSLNPNMATAHLGRGDALYALARYSEALQAYDRAVSLMPRLGEAWSGRGLALRALGRYPESEAAFARARELGYTGAGWYA